MITKQDLLGWLENVDQKLSKDIVLVAVGGTALTLLGLKESTRDVDFCLSEDDFSHFKDNSSSKIFVVDLFRDGYIFSLQLPKDYMERAEAIPFSGKHMVLKALSLDDIIVTKTARFHARDIEDIQAVLKTGKIQVESLKRRFQQVLESYAGNEEEYQRHFQLVLQLLEKLKKDV